MIKFIYFIILGIWIIFIIQYLINKVYIFLIGFLTIKTLIEKYILIRKVKAVKDFQDDFLKFQDKKRASEIHLDNLYKVQNQKVEDYLQYCIGYYPSIINLIVGFLKWLVSANKNFTVPESGYNYIMVLLNFVEFNKEYLNFEIVVNEKL